MKFNVRSIRGKIFLMVTSVILFMFVLLFIINNYFLSYYYLHKMKVNLGESYNNIKQLSASEIEKKSEEILYNKGVILVSCNKVDDINTLNEDIVKILKYNNIYLSKFWITEDVIKQLDSGKDVNRIFNQGRIKSSFLVKLFEKEGKIFLMGISVIHDSDVVSITNEFHFYIIIFAMIISLILVWFSSRAIVLPLQELRDLSKDIADLNFKKVNIKTNDEIEELSESINSMSENLKKAHEDLERQNESLKQLISSISHEFKTPLALIKAYSVGIKDGFDDGTYVDIIMEQVDNTSLLVDSVLELSKSNQMELKKEVFSIKEVLENIANRYKITLDDNHIVLNLDTTEFYNDKIIGDKQQLEIVFNNLFSNAIKYNEGDYINIDLKNDKETLVFSISNKCSKVDEDMLQNLWNPFFVAETSRDKRFSGTGLGLSIVANILKNHNIFFESKISKDNIRFNINFPSIN